MKCTIAVLNFNHGQNKTFEFTIRNDNINYDANQMKCSDRVG